VQKGKVVNWDVVQKGDSPADKENNVPRPAHHTKRFHFHGVSKFLFPHAASASADRALLRVLFPDSGGAGQAKYCLSVARKMGCSVFLLWQDVVRVPKIIT